MKISCAHLRLFSKLEKIEKLRMKVGSPDSKEVPAVSKVHKSINQSS